MNKSTDINNLPNINNLTESAGDEDNTIHEVLAEIQNENEAQFNGPQVPIEAIQQMPPQPVNNINQPMNQNQQMQQLQQMQQPSMNNINHFVSQQSPSKINIIMNEINKNMKLFITIIFSYGLLQNSQVQNLITSRLVNINVPYINIIALSITQVAIILGSKLLF